MLFDKDLNIGMGEPELYFSDTNLDREYEFLLADRHLEGDDLLLTKLSVKPGYGLESIPRVPLPKNYDCYLFFPWRYSMPLVKSILTAQATACSEVMEALKTEKEVVDEGPIVYRLAMTRMMGWCVYSFHDDKINRDWKYVCYYFGNNNFYVDNSIPTIIIKDSVSIISGNVFSRIEFLYKLMMKRINLWVNRWRNNIK